MVMPQRKPTQAAVELRPLRILHVIMRMDRGGIETSLMQLLRTVDRQRYRMDFLALHGQPGAQDDEVRALSSQIIVCDEYRKPWRFARQFDRIMRDYGPYDVIHSHTHFYGGYVLRLAARRRIPQRIAHSRNDTRITEQGRGWQRRAYVWMMRRWIREYANVHLAVSKDAAEDLFGVGWRRGGEIIRSGRDFSAYARSVDRAAVRAELGLPVGAFVLGHVGRFYRRKNHPFLIEVAAELFRRIPDAKLLLVGDGPCENEIAGLVRAKGLTERVNFAGDRADVPRLMKGAMDAFVLPSHHEGLSLAVVEAQAAGLPCVVSGALTSEMDVVSALIHRLPLAAPASVWAEQILSAARGPRPTPEEALAAIKASPFGIEKSAQRLCEIYDSVRTNGAEL